MALTPTKTCDFKNPEFVKWLEENHILKPQGEKDIDFAYDALRFVKNYLTYSSEAKYSAVASEVIKSRKASCGGSSILYAAILRANGIPAHVRAGVLATTGPLPQRAHVRVEAYFEGVGYRVIEVSGALQHSDEIAYRCFTEDPGDHLTYHVDTDMVMKDDNSRAFTIQWCQVPGMWVILAEGSIEGLVSHDEWQCHELPQ